MARKHFNSFGRPLGFLHCSVIDSDNVESFARNGNTFGKDFGGQRLGYRDVSTDCTLVCPRIIHAYPLILTPSPAVWIVRVGTTS